MLNLYFKSLYQRTMDKAYDTAYSHIASSVDVNSQLLDCGAGNGGAFQQIAGKCGLQPTQYQGIEWDQNSVNQGCEKGLNIRQGDLNIGLNNHDESFSCVYALSVLEHLLNPCRFLRDCHRTLRPGGQLVVLTPNISTYFTAALILLGKMPSSGPHPDSEQLLKEEELFKVSSHDIISDAESDMPRHRHLVVFSYRVLRQYLAMIGFTNIQGYGFGLYPFPRFMQPLLERVDPYHCHQMVFVARK